MTDEERELHRKLQVLRHAEQSGHVSKTCRYFGICRASFLSLARRVSPGCRRGITPTLAMAEAALVKGGREVAFLHYARNGDVHAFAQTLEDWAAHYPQFQSFIVYEQGDLGEDSKADALGRPAIDHLERWVPASRACDAYFLGPKPFMAFIKRGLAALGLASSRMHYEFFGPAEALD